jgi:hypothetical protein
VPFGDFELFQLSMVVLVDGIDSICTYLRILLAK